MQALLLLSQTLATREWGRVLLLDGPDIALGSVTDVMNQGSGSRQLRLGAVAGSERVVWTFSAEDRRALSAKLESVEFKNESLRLPKRLRWLLPVRLSERSMVVGALRRISWIAAERTGPREILPLHDAQGHHKVGANGELAAGLLHWREYEPVDEELCLPKLPPTLFHQVRGQMNEFFPGADLRIVPIDGVSAVSLLFRSSVKSDFLRPQNVGFGLTQLFPILVAVLSACKGDIILVENPEVHLHPQAQQRIGVLLSRVAEHGVQVVVETHSDHVLNGIRIAAKTNVIAPSNVAVHFLSHHDGVSKIESPKLDEDGRLDSWPSGFFDQFDHAISQLL